MIIFHTHLGLFKAFLFKKDKNNQYFKITIYPWKKIFDF